MSSRHSCVEQQEGICLPLQENYPGHGAVERKEAMTQKGYFTYYFPGKVGCMRVSGQLVVTRCLIHQTHSTLDVQEFVRFHLYINTAPCGDARIFSPHEPGTGAATAISPKGGIVNQGKYRQLYLMCFFLRLNLVHHFHGSLFQAGHVFHI